MLLEYDDGKIYKDCLVVKAQNMPDSNGLQNCAMITEMQVQQHMVVSQYLKKLDKINKLKLKQTQACTGVNY